MSIVAEIGLAPATLILLWLLLVAVRNGRIARSPCPLCGRKLGAAASGSIDYYKRRYGAGVVVFDGPSQYRHARVVKCLRCQTEFVFSEIGGFVERFRETEDPFV